MHDAALRSALAAFAEEAAYTLSSELQSGAEIPFELESSGEDEWTSRRSSPTLYCYKPQTSRFIGERLGVLTGLATYAPAARLLEGKAGLGSYLRARGHTRMPSGDRARADAALSAFLGRMWLDATSFAIEPARFDRAFAELERSLYAGRTLTCVAVAVEGLRLSSPEVPLGEGITLTRADALADPPALLTASGADAIALVRDERAPDAGPAIEHAGRSLRRLQTALRLWDDGAIALSPLAFTRADGGEWAVVALPVGTRRTRSLITVGAEEEDPLRAFCSLVSARTPRAGALAWALRRFELGLERATPFEALTDWLLAARAILGAIGEDHALLADRLAAICAAGPDERAALADGVDDLVALEGAVICAHVSAEPELVALIEAFGGHVRAILRDVLCGHLDPDVRELADRLLAAAVEEVPFDAQ